MTIENNIAKSAGNLAGKLTTLLLIVPLVKLLVVIYHGILFVLFGWLFSDYLGMFDMFIMSVTGLQSWFGLGLVVGMIVAIVRKTKVNED